ncbi:MAG: 2-C-methyl-D-erythritol 2,4-cyclodiphosphate synthase [candidate division WOR-3 bacterium]|nr:2-C-methyl-D-erythritol 2,4-cyclodiphosphate synthase [candidate division WOR-3 bacterium]MCX7947698.1 2-C-methyl-D-erythritol 2,4-cyclodiphosphate synthase [candidate division WOR-3 bacterium]MDW8150575.1 2-C-methyl-D-erythritol 2,4-cyclodiphosphate synthase [candidate division WOR-3 bacterium]
MNSKFTAIILGGGEGRRFGAYKQFEKVLNIPIYELSIRAFYGLVDEIILVIPKGFNVNIRDVKIVYGGDSREKSSYNGIINSSCDYVLIHDVVRPLLNKELVMRIKEELLNGNDAVVPYIKLRDTIRDLYGNDLNREELMLIQTPQGFRKELIKLAYEKAFEKNIFGTDDAFYYKLFVSSNIKYIEGELENFKITYKSDIKILEKLLMSKIKVGIGYDIHPIVEGRKLIIGGVEITSEFGALGHSDGDVLIHALIDSLGGILLNKSIGELYPEIDKYKDILSLELLKDFSKYLGGIKILNIDAIIVLSRPKLLPYIDKIKENISNILNIDTFDVSVKAKSGNSLKDNFVECFLTTSCVIMNYPNI